MLNFVNVINRKQKKLDIFNSKSSKALSVVDVAIDRSTDINEKITLTIGEIDDLKEKLQLTEDNLSATKLRNEKVINQYKSMLN